MRTRLIRSIWLAVGLAMFFTAFASASASALVVTENATNVEGTAAVLNGMVNAEGHEDSCKFEYGTTTSYGTSQSVGKWGGSENNHVSAPVTGLAEGTTYHFRFSCLSFPNIINGEDKTFTTLYRPVATTGGTSDIFGTGATLYASVNPHGTATSYWFEYGKTTGYGTKIPITPESVGSGSSAVSVSQSATALARNTTYHYRVVAQSAAGTSYGADKTFATVDRPQATTEAATAVTGTAATLHGSVNPEAQKTSYWFEYGTTTAYGSKTAVGEAGFGTANVAVSQTITGLAQNTTYHVRLVAANGIGTTYGSDVQFKTAKAVTEAASGVTATQATLNATVNAQGNPMVCHFQWGLTVSYGSSNTGVGVEGSSDTPISFEVTGLTPNTTYHYRVSCVMVGGGFAGEDRTFTTSF